MKQNKSGAQDDGRVLTAHLLDLSRRRDERNTVTYSDFLNDSEQRAAQSAVDRNGGIFFGGFDDAERRVAVFLPDYFTPDDIAADPGLCGICFLNIKLSDFDRSAGAEIGNRDILGALMSLGIKRESVGDIAVSDGTASVAVTDRICDFIAGELRSVGRYAVSVSKSGVPEVKSAHRYSEKRLTVASPRLDGIVSGVFGISREKSSDCVRAGLVSLNGEVALKPDVQLETGDTVSLRGYGKARIVITGGVSRKGRAVISALIYK